MCRRKVLGASIAGIATLVAKDFMILVFIAFAVAAPVAWLTMNKWLQTYAYRIDISWLTFLMAGFLLVIIALITVNFQSIKAAMANPIKSLRTD